MIWPFRSRNKPADLGPQFYLLQGAHEKCRQNLAHALMTLRIQSGTMAEQRMQIEDLKAENARLRVPLKGKRT